MDAAPAVIRKVGNAGHKVRERIRFSQGKRRGGLLEILKANPARNQLLGVFATQSPKGKGKQPVLQRLSPDILGGPHRWHGVEKTARHRRRIQGSVRREKSRIIGIAPPIGFFLFFQRVVFAMQIVFRFSLRIGFHRIPGGIVHMGTERFPVAHFAKDNPVLTGEEANGDLHPVCDMDKQEDKNHKGCFHR